MGRKHAKGERLIPEQNRRICGGICVCQFTMVMSCVALVYLTVAIYIPSHRAFRSGIDPVPVTCQTVATVMANNCQWASCGEWCLTKTSGFCPQINVTVRRNGTDLIFEGCSRVRRHSCPGIQLEKLHKYNCNNGSECERLTGVFHCKNGHCINMSEAMQCPVRAGSPTINSEHQNRKLNGNFLCKNANCTTVKHHLKCDRLCDKIEGAGKGVFVVHGDDVVAADCARVLSLHEANRTAPGRAINATEFWPARAPPPPNTPHAATPPTTTSTTTTTTSTSTTASGRSGHSTTVGTPRTAPEALLVTCREVVETEDSIRGVDCVNGSLAARGEGAGRLPDVFNFTSFREAFARALARPADPFLRYAPPQPALTIYNSSRLQINLEACVNTLQDECRAFLRTHGRDGANDTAPSQFPCFFDKSDGFFVVARFDLEKTLRELVVAVAVPAALFVVSWASLCVITRSVKVGDDARMRCHCCGGDGADGECAARRGRRARATAAEEERDPDDEGAGCLDPVERAVAAEAEAAAAAHAAALGAAPATAPADDDEETELVMAVPPAPWRPLEGRDNRAMTIPA